MQTNLSDKHKQTDYGKEADRILRKCVHCGFCNATCPTYQILGDELDGPRGRIYQIKNFLEGEDCAEQLQTHLDRCLTCRACETTCPSGVEYHTLLDIGRELAEKHARRPWYQQIQRRALILVLSNRKIFGALMSLARLTRPFLPTGLKKKIPAKKSIHFVAKKHKRFVILLEGCVQPELAPNINLATQRVFDKLGIRVSSSPHAGCCGALPHHLSDTEKAREMARKNIDAWWPEIDNGAESIIINTSGCAPMVKDYIKLFSDNPDYREKAQRVSEMTLDISEFLAQEDLSMFTPGKHQRIAFQSPCSLQHAQKITLIVEPILTQAGFELTTVTDPHLCCGSAGTYSILQPQLSKQLRSNKLQSLEDDQPEIIATANIGCMMHLSEKACVPVKHWIELLDDERGNMNTTDLPLVIEPDELTHYLQTPQVVVIHITKPEVYAKQHIPGALFVAGSQFIRIEKPVMGLLPELTVLNSLLSSLGINNNTHVIAYDDEGGGWAGRFLWTLDAMGHKYLSLLNGGLIAWCNEGFPVSQANETINPQQYSTSGLNSAQVNCEYILSRLGSDDFALLDSRTPEEFSGQKRLSSRGGHIPGAANLNWLDTMDKSRNFRLLSDPLLREQLESRGLTPDKEIVCYCQSHHRSSHAYMMLKKLGYERISGYPGAWSDWGNRSDTPLE